MPRWLALTCIVLIVPIAASAKYPATSDPDIQRALQAYHESIREEQYLEASVSVKLALSLLLKNPDHDRMVYGRLLTLLADAQYFAGLYSPAIQNYEMAIEIIQSARNRLHSDLVAPYLGLSRSLIANGQHAEAIRNYRHTLHVQQVNNGLYHERAAELAAEISEAYFASRDFDRANGMQDMYVSIIRRNFPGDDLQQLPSLYSRAKMLSRTGDYSRSYDAYRRIIALIEKADGPRSLQLVPALSATAALLGSSYIADGEDGTEKATRYLRRAVAITESSERANDLDKANIRIVMGDFLSQQTANRRAVVRNYKRGWHYLNDNPNHHAYRDKVFGDATLLESLARDTPAAMLRILENAAGAEADMNGHIVVTYDVDEGGRPDNVRVVRSVPPGLHDYMVKNYVQSFAFRPRFVEGEPVRSPDHRFELRFSFDEEEGESAEEPIGDVAEVTAANLSYQPL